MHRSAIAWKPLKGEVKNIVYPITLADVAASEKNLTKAKLWWQDNWVGASPKWWVLWSVPNTEWIVSTKTGSRKDNLWTGSRIMCSQGSAIWVGHEG